MDTYERLKTECLRRIITNEGMMKCRTGIIYALHTMTLQINQ